ncbi:uncharacterized protein LOC103510742 [Diaphorina citri]|uniref:Uncharacterized protein LOC103510742 n=1 Tax=Diaphorina citri TaxID=121845 RepID=A0A1S3D3S5_DIACI|nr:uncharacterized protein LOC103510742 [Diaphorina citri]
MGNSHSSHSPNGSSKGLSRNNSKKEHQEVDKVPKQALPTDLLAKVLTEKSLEQDIQGIGCSVFKKYLFPQYPELGRRIFAYLITQSGYPASSHVISTAHFRTQAEKIIGILTEEQQVSIYVTMFADGKEEMDQKQFSDLLYSVYKLTMDHYPEGPQSCRHIFKTLKAVVDSAVHVKSFTNPQKFLHHVLSYKGPTLTFLRGENDNVFCVGATSEWHESHQYWGAQDCIILQILPLYRVIEKGPKLIYLNTSIRGYPMGIRAGSDPRKPALEINADLSQMTYAGAPYPLYSVEVWGCGDIKSRETQLEIKSWQVKQAEKQRCVKLSAKEWMDHPDRYLLELAGRTNYVDGGDRS